MSFRGTPRFAIRRQLGAGGMGVVYEALDREHNQPVALKVLHKPSRDGGLRLRQEFGALRALAHPNLVSLGELYEDDEGCFFTMELVRGCDLIHYLRPHGHAFDPARVRDALAQLTRGLMAIHASGKVHRDIKPPNVLVGEQGRVVLLDFGLVADADTIDEPISARGSGTVAYMAPEQAVGHAVGPEADWYSVGVVLYEALVGEPPFRGPALQIIADKQIVVPVPPRVRFPGVPEDLDAMCCELLHIEPGRRPSGRALLRRLGLREATASVPSRFVPPSTIGRHELLVGRAPELAVLSAALAEVRAGRQVALVVHGGSGVGKSTLLRSFVAGAAAGAAGQPAPLVLSARCHPDDPAPYPGVGRVVEALAAQLERLPAAEVLALRPARAALLATIFPAFRRGTAFADAPGHEIVDALERRVAMFAALRQLLGRLAARAPVIVVVDDLEHADADALMLLGELAQPGLLLLASAAAPLTGWPGELRQLELGDLPPDAALELAALLLARAQHAGAADSADASTLASAAAGRPLVLEELIKAGVLAPGRAWPRAAHGTIDLEPLILARLVGLEAVQLRILELCAVAGAPLDQTTAATCAGLDAPVFARHAALLQVVELLRFDAETRTVEIWHESVRAALLTQLSPSERIERHGSLLRTLEASGRAPARALLHHGRHADLSARAGRWAREAGQAADAALAFDRAARCYQDALELAPADARARQALHAALGDARARSGRGREAASAYLLAVEGATAAAALDLQRRAAQQLLLTGHIEEGIATLSRLLELEGIALPRTPMRALPALLASRVQLRLRGLGHQTRTASCVPEKELTRLDACLSVGASLAIVDPLRGHLLNVRGLLLALRAGEPARLACALALEGGFRATTGRRGVRAGEALFAAAEALALQATSAQPMALVQLARAQTAVLDGRFASALTLCEQASTTLRERCVGALFELPIMHLATCNALQQLGQHARLAILVPTLLRELDGRGDLYGATDLRLQEVPTMCLVADDPARALAEAAQPLPGGSTTSGYHVHHYLVNLAEALALLYQGKSDEALALVRARWAGLERSYLLRVQYCRIIMYGLRARAALAAAPPGDAGKSLRAHAAADARRLERERMPWPDALAGLLHAGLAAARGDREAARVQLTAAAAAFDAVDLALHAAVARRRLGRLLGGDEGRALIVAADVWMAGQTIRNPERMTALLAPGFRE